MNKNNKKIILFLSISIVIMTTLFISIAYSYFVAKIKNNESKSTISVAGGEMIINYQDNTGVITASKIIPSWTTTKKFTVSGKNDTKINDVSTDNNMYYKIVLVIDNNTFSKGALTYSLKQDSSSSTNGQMATNASGTINQSGKQYLGHGYFSTTSTFVNHIYNLTISFPDTGKDQSIDNAKSFAGHIVISEYTSSTPFDQASWNEIANNVKVGNMSLYPVGSEKEVEIGGKSYTVRVANNTTPDECDGEDFSQTACGFVVEFVDILEKRKFTSKGTTVGGWPAMELHSYANGDFFNKLPSDLQKVIIDTKVISGHGSGDTSNFTSTDKIYLLSGKEVLDSNSYDTASSQTRQLDYYKNKGVTTNNDSDAMKQYNSSNFAWFLRVVNSNTNNSFLCISDYDPAGDTNLGFAPAFRIG